MHRPATTTPSRLGPVLVAMTLALLLVACNPPGEVGRGGIHAPDSQTRLDHIIEAGRTGDGHAIAPLIEQLDSDDPAVRLYAITALRRITGQQMGYSPYASQATRQPAIRRWTAALESGQLHAQQPDPAEAPLPDPAPSTEAKTTDAM